MFWLSNVKQVLAMLNLYFQKVTRSKLSKQNYDAAALRFFFYLYAWYISFSEFTKTPHTLWLHIRFCCLITTSCDFSFCYWERGQSIFVQVAFEENKCEQTMLLFLWRGRSRTICHLESVTREAITSGWNRPSLLSLFLCLPPFYFPERAQSRCDLAPLDSPPSFTSLSCKKQK